LLGTLPNDLLRALDNEPIRIISTKLVWKKAKLFDEVEWEVPR
jgi:hypothetical protein